MARVKTKPSFQQSVLPSEASVASSAAPSVATPPAAKPATHLYFVNAPVDYFIIGFGSILTYLILLLVYQSAPVPWAIELAWAMQLIINHPHFAATNYRLYHNRENIMQYPITALVIPWLILAVMIASFLSPNFIAVIFIKVFLYWSPYHFSGQTLGITLIYARRAGFFVGKWERFTLSNTIYSSFLFMTARGDMITAAADLVLPTTYDVEMYRLGLPTWVPWLILGWLVINALGFTYFVVKWSIAQKRMLPPIVLLPLITQLVWFIPGSWCPSFYLFVPMFHSLQYLLIAWSLQLKEKMDTQKITPSVSYVVQETGRWGVINLLLGGFLFFLIPKSLYFLLSEQYTLPFTYTFVNGIIVAGVQVHHFFVDGVIWKLKKKTVASPLMVNIDDLIHAPAQPAVQGAMA